MQLPRLPHTFLAALVVLFGFSLRLADLGGQSLWVDEGISLDRIVDFPRWLLADIHPPLYFVSMAPWVRLTGTSEAAFRFPSAAWSILTIAVVYLLGKRLFGPRAGLLAGLFQALSAFAITYAQEARMYSLITMEYAFVVLFAAQWLIDGDRRLRVTAGYILAAIATMATHSFAAFCLVGLNLGVGLIALYRHMATKQGPLAPTPTPPPSLGEGQWERARPFLAPGMVRWGAMQFAALGIFSPWIGVTLYQVSVYPGRDAPVPAPAWVLGNAWMAANLGTSLEEHQAGGALAALGAIAVGGLTLLLIRRPASWLPAAFLAGALLLPLALYMAILPSQPHYHARYLLPLTPVYYVLLGAAVAALGVAARLARAVAASAVAAAMLGGVALYFFNAPYQKEEARQIAYSLNQRALATEAVVGDPVQPLHHYYRADTPLVQTDRERAPRDLTAALQGRTGVWFVQWYQSTLDYPGQIPYLLAKYGRLERMENWRGYRVSHYDLPTPISRVEVEENARPIGVRFEPGFQLVSAGYGPSLADRSQDEAVVSGGVVWAALRWRLLEPLTRDAKATVQLVDLTGAPVAQADSDLALGIAGTKNTAAGQDIITYHILQIPAGLPPDTYELHASAYWKPTGPRLSPEPGPSARGAVVVLGDLRVARTSTPRPPTGEELPFEREVALGPEITFMGHATRLQEIVPGDQVGAVVFWRAHQTPSAHYALRMLLLRPDKSIALVGPDQPLSDRYSSRVWQAGEIVRAFPRLTITGEVAPGWYSIAMEVGPAGSAHQLIDLASVHILEPPPSSITLGSPQTRLNASLAAAIELQGYDLNSQTAAPGDTLTLALYWRGQRSISERYTVFTHVLDSSGRVVAQHDGPPANGTRPTPGWRVGEVVLDEHRIELPRNLAPGSYILRIGMYDPATMKRAPLVAPGADVVDDALRLTELGVR